MTSRSYFAALVISLAGCAGPTAPIDPTEVVLGEATFVVLVNPALNEIDDDESVELGAARADVAVFDRELAIGGRTGADGVVVVAPLAGGARTLDLDGPSIGASVTESIGERDLVELAVATSGAEASVEARVVHPFGREVVSLTPEMGIDAVNAALSASDRIVLLGGGVYRGNLVFSGSRVTLFGAGELGGLVTIDGNVTVSGSDNGLRGAHVTGTVEVSGSHGAITFSRVDGRTMVSGSDVVFLANDFCGEVSVSGSHTIALGNRGVAPIAGARCDPRQP